MEIHCIGGRAQKRRNMLPLGAIPYEYLYFPTGRKASQVVLAIKKLPANAGDARDGFSPWVGKIPGGGNGNPLQYSCPGESRGQRSLARCTPWGHKEPDMTEHTAQHIGRNTCKVLLCSRVGRMLVKAISQTRDGVLPETKTES